MGTWCSSWYTGKIIENQDQIIKDLNDIVKQKDNEILNLKVDISEHKSATEEKEKLAKGMAEKDADIKILQENNQKLYIASLYHERNFYV